MAFTVIAEFGDLTIEVVEFDSKIVNQNREPVIRKTQEFLVSRETLIQNSPHFKVLLRTDKFKEAHKDTIKLQDDSVKSMEIWFRTLHAVKAIYEADLEEMWHLAAAGNKYQFDITKLRAWFAAWYQLQDINRWYEFSQRKELRNSVPDPRSLWYPCWIFDHYKGFLCITGFSAYHYVGHVSEVNPTKHYDLHLPPRVTQQLNAAKGRLRTVIHRELYKPVKRMLDASCSCKEVTLFNYQKALTDIKVWPLEDIAQHTPMCTIIERLSKFSFEPKPSACNNCRSSYKAIVELARSRTRGYFDGLCLDCMDKSKSKTDDEDTDYWEHNNLDEDDVIRGCRTSHGQPTWYFSYMGRREVRDKFLRAKRMARYEGDSE